MKLVHPEIDTLFDTDGNYVNTIIIENQSFYYSFLSELNEQVNGADGKIVLSDDNTVISVQKNLELLSDFIPFELNKKSLVNKLAASLEKVSTDAEHYSDTMRLVSELEDYMYKLSFECTGDILFPKLSAGTLIKAAAPVFNEEYESLSEKVLDYMELVYEYECKKLFVTVSMRSFISDTDANLFMKSVLMHGFHVIMVENYAYPKCEYEKRTVIDSDLCEIT